MKTTEEIRIVNDLIKISDKNENFFENKIAPSKSFGLGESNISFTGLEAVSQYQEGLEKLYSSKTEIEQTISIKEFEKSLIVLMRTLRDKKNQCSSDDIDSFFKNLLALEKNEYEILYELYGAEMNGDILNLGEFTVFNLSHSNEKLVEKYPPLINRDLYFTHSKSNIYLGIRVTARENSKAVEISDELLETFENVMNYMIADLKHQRCVGNINFRGWKSIQRIICGNSSMGINSSSDISLPVNIEDPFFKDGSQGNDNIWFLITKQNKTELEKRLLQSIEWIGKAIHDKDKSKALVQFVFAIEGMLKYDEKSLITPSIVSQLSDWLAFIIQDDYIKRKEIANYFKAIYKKRSAIVHGGSKTIDIEDLRIALQISKLMIISFLKTKPFCDFTSMQEVNDYITELKFK